MAFPSSPTAGQTFVTPRGKKFVWSAADGWTQQAETGAKIIASLGFPTNTLGNDGDYCLSTNPSALYGPKAAGVWPLPGTLIVVGTDPTIIFPTIPVSGLYITFPVLTSVAVSGGTEPYTFSITAGSLPNGLVFTASTGAISGTPTGPVGTYTFTVTAVDGIGNTQSQTYTGTVSAIGTLIIPVALPTLTQVTPFNASVAATGGVPPYTYSVVTGALPPGLSLSPSSGSISGQTPNTGTYSFAIQVQDARGIPATNLYAGTIHPLNNLSITPTAMNIQQSLAVNVALTSTGTGPFTWSVSTGSLPAGLSLNSVTGAVTGTPTGTGAYDFTIESLDSTGNSASQEFMGNANGAETLNIYPGSITIPRAGAMSTQFVASGGTSPYTWAVVSGALPNGLSLSSTGMLSGTDNPSGAWAFTVRVTDHLGFTTFQAYSGNDAVSPGAQTWVGTAGFTGGGYPIDTNDTFIIPAYNWLTIEGWGGGGGGGSAGWQDGINAHASTCNGLSAGGGGGGIGQQSGAGNGGGGSASGGNSANINGGEGKGWSGGLPIGGGDGANGGTGGAGGRWAGSAGNFPGGGGGGGAAGNGGGGAYAKSTYVPGALAVGQGLAVTAGGGGNGGYAGTTWANGGGGAAGKITITWG